MKTGILVLLFVIVLLGGYITLQTRSLKEEQQSVRELTAKLDATGKAASLDLQAKCAQQAQRVFDSDWKKFPSASFTNHYNAVRNQCFVLIQTGHIDKDVRATTRYLFDAYEGRDYAELRWMNATKTKDEEVVPYTCSVTVPSGEKKACRSFEEFEQLLKHYMEH